MANPPPLSFIFNPPFPPRHAHLRHKPPTCTYPTGKSPSSTRIFLDTPLVPGARHSLTPSEHAHIRARRLQPGANITLFNSRGLLATAVLHDDQSVTVLSNVNPTPQSLNIAAVVGIPKSPQRADWIVEKLTELGAHRISFCHTARTVPKAPGQARLDRWQRLVVAATKQSLRSDIPVVEYVEHFSSVLEMVENAQLALLLSPNGAPLLSKGCLEWFDHAMQVVVLVGPEGGFTDEEEHSMVRAGARCVAIGTNRLRVDTAAITAVGVVSQLAFGSSLDSTRQLYTSVSDSSKET